MKSKISLITLGVADVARSLEFYRDGLGFETHDFTEGDDHPMLKLEGTWLALYSKEKLAAGANIPVNEGPYSGMVLAHNVATKPEVDAVFRLALDAGAEALAGPAGADWGGYSAHFADPDGHVWSVACNPFTDLT